jgi:hypothetical protein
MTVLTTCDDKPMTTAPDISQPQFEISDAAHLGGNPDFFFLPPLVSNPIGHPDFSADGFDGTQSPEVEICVLEGEDCASVLVTYTRSTGHATETVRVIDAEEHYIVNWHTDQFDLDQDVTYRIRVLVAGTELGYADVDAVSSGKELKNVDTDEYIPLKDGRTLPIKFRIEDGAVFVLDSNGGTITALDGKVTLDIPAGATDGPIGITVRVATVDILPPFVLPDAIYEFGPDGSVFTIPLTLTIQYDEASLPSGFDEAELGLYKLVDEQWQFVPGSTVDSDGNTVSGPIVSFSRLGVARSRRIEVVEQVTVSDEVDLLPPVVIEIAETIAVSDAVELMPPVVIEVAETIQVGDAVGAVPSIIIAVNEAIGVSDEVQLIPPVLIEVVEAVAVGDAVGAMPPITVAVSEAIGVSDEVQVLPSVLIEVVEAVAVSDAVGAMPPITVAVSEAIGVSDEVQVLPSVLIEVVETIQAGDQVLVSKQ